MDVELVSHNPAMNLVRGSMNIMFSKWCRSVLFCSTDAHYFPIDRQLSTIWSTVMICKVNYIVKVFED